jgi:hypothetical protein
LAQQQVKNFLTFGLKNKNNKKMRIYSVSQQPAKFQPLESTGSDFEKVLCRIESASVIDLFGKYLC